MTVVLVGVGADSDHVQPKLKLTEDGAFDYIPIPESYPTEESMTYGDWPLKRHGGTAADFVEALSPRGADSEWIRNEEAIRSHPVHHDPNFEAMSFGDRRGGGGTGTTLTNHLGNDSEEDILGFYTGAVAPDDPNLNRYLYGFMTVEEIHDISGLAGQEYRDALRQFPENAHAKRLFAADEPKHDDLVIVEGTAPAEKLSYPIKVSKRIKDPPWYRVSERFARDFNVRGGMKGIGRKFPLVLDITASEFVEKVDPHACSDAQK